ncbi:MAG: GAF domain-containing protein [Anaerolineales bacterium]|nr:GAF domain-containing protein [Anaerolineales bacterium]
MGQTLDLTTIYRTVYRLVRTSMPCNTLIVSSFDNNEQLIRCVYVNHLGEEHDVSGFPPITLEASGAGIQSDVIHTGESLIINDFQARIKETEGNYYVDNDGSIHEETPDEEEVTRSALLIPMKLDNQVHGVLQIQSHLLNAFNAGHLQLLEAFAPQVAAARNNAILFAQAQREIAKRIQAQEAEKEQRVFAEALRDTAVALNSTFNLEKMFDDLLQNVGRVIPHDSANILLFEGDHANIVHYQGRHSQCTSYEAMVNTPVLITQISNYANLANSKTPILVPNTATDPNWTIRPQTAWVKSYLGVPIIIGDRTIGSLNLDSAEPNFFTQMHAEQLQVFANYTAVAIQNSRLYHELAAQNTLLEGAVNARTAELQHAMAQVNAILTNSPDAILLLGTNGKIISHNPASSQMFGWSTQTDIPDLLQSCLASPMHISKFKRAFQEVLTKSKPTRFDSLAERRDGSQFDAEIALAPIRRNGLIINIICTLHDISALKEIERMKDAFVSNVSHELRTPLASLRLHNDLVHRNPKKAPVYMQRITRDIDRLNVLIEDLLQLSRLDQDRTAIGMLPLNITDLISQYITDRQILAQENGLAISCELTASLPLVLADEGLIGQVLSILLTNAINYTPENGRITVSSIVSKHDNKIWVGIQVADTGYGISQTEQAAIFDRFYRGETGRSSGAPGTGLGLSIAQEIISRHQGRIEVISEGIPGKGSRFIIWLPAAIITNKETSQRPIKILKNGIMPAASNGTMRRQTGYFE